MSSLLKIAISAIIGLALLALGVILTIYAYQTDPAALEQFSQTDPQATMWIAYLLLLIMFLATGMDWLIQRKAA